MSLTVQAFQDAAKTGGQILFDQTNKEYIKGTGTGFKGWRVRRQLTKGLTKDSLVQQNQKIIDKFIETIKNQDGDACGNVALLLLESAKVAGKPLHARMITKVLEGVNLAKECIGNNNKMILSSFLSEDNPNTNAMINSWNNAGLQRWRVNTNFYKPCFEALARESLPELSGHGTKPITPQQIKETAQNKLTALFKAAEDAMTKSSPDITSDDKNILRSLMLHPSIVKVPEKQRPLAMEMIAKNHEEILKQDLLPLDQEGRQKVWQAVTKEQMPSYGVNENNFILRLKNRYDLVSKPEIRKAINNFQESIQSYFSVLQEEKGPADILKTLQAVEIAYNQLVTNLSSTTSKRFDVGAKFNLFTDEFSKLINTFDDSKLEKLYNASTQKDIRVLEETMGQVGSSKSLFNTDLSKSLLSMHRTMNTVWNLLLEKFDNKGVQKPSPADIKEPLKNLTQDQKAALQQYFGIQVDDQGNFILKNK